METYTLSNGVAIPKIGFGTCQIPKMFNKCIRQITFCTGALTDSALSSLVL